MPDDAGEHPRRECVGAAHARDALGQQAHAAADGGVDVERSLILQERELEMVRRVNRRVETDRRAVRRPRVREIDVLAERAVDAERGDATRWTESREIVDLSPFDDAVARARLIVDVG